MTDEERKHVVVCMGLSGAIDKLDVTGFSEKPGAIIADGIELLPKYVLDLDANPGVEPLDPTIKGAMEAVAKTYGVKRFNAISVETPQRHLFDPNVKEEDERGIFYLWLRWWEDEADKVETQG